MGKIAVLPEALANQIAAGEVVERPASVVKELVENSLDAGATRIRVAIQQGGRAHIEVEDNGEGMSAEDCRLALQRHATSKIRDAADLERIATLGFRGEALPSIAAVSRLTLTSAPREDEPGSSLEVEGGTLVAERREAAPRGTRVVVRDLFFNVPARRKFLKRPPTESSHVLRCLEEVALVRPRLHLSLKSGPRTVLDSPGVGSLRERAIQVLNLPREVRLLEWEETAGPIRLHLLCTPPQFRGGTAQGQHYFVNGRAVQDRLLRHAVREGLAQILLQGAVPAFLCFLDLPPDRVDVNVHPTKREVRFRESQQVHRALVSALKDLLSRSGALPTVSAASLKAGWAAGKGAGPAGYPAPPPGPAPRVREAPGPARPPRPAAFAPPEGAGASLPVAVPPVRPLAQYKDSFVVGYDEEGLVLIDQHVAHERILFEQLQAAGAGRPVASQRLLEPLRLELPPHQLPLLAGVEAAAAGLGYDLEPFGGNTLLVRAVPAPVPPETVEGIFRALLEEEGPVTRERLLEHTVASRACRAAVKIRNQLTIEGIRRVIADLFACREPLTCPHGRPVLIRLTDVEIEKLFRRR